MIPYYTFSRKCTWYVVTVILPPIFSYFTIGALCLPVEVLDL